MRSASKTMGYLSGGMDLTLNDNQTLLAMQQYLSNITIFFYLKLQIVIITAINADSFKDKCSWEMPGYMT